MLNSAVGGAQADYARRRSSTRSVARGSMARQVQRICDSDDDSTGEQNDTTTTPLASGLKTTILNPPRRRNSLGPVRYSIAKRLKAEEERESFNAQNTPALQPNFSEDAYTLQQKHSAIYPEDRSHNESSFIDENEMTNGARRSRVTRPWFILLPQNKYRMGWDIIMAWLLAFMAFYIPYRVCLYWDDDSKSDSIYWFELCADILFGVDILLIFFTAYHDNRTNTLVTNPKAIACHYLRGFFIVDLIATAPFGYLLSNPSFGIANKVGKLGRLPKMIKFLRAVRLLKLLRVYKLQQFILKLEVEYNIHHGISRLLKIVMTVMLVTHLVGCFWYLVGLSGGEDVFDGGWMYRFSFDDKSTEAKYVASIYWAFSTLTTVGYGDISARTPQEQGYSMLMMLLGVSWYAYIVSSMSTVMSTFDAQNKAVRDKIMCVNEFIRAAKLPSDLSKQVRDFFDFKLAHSQRAFLMSKHYDADEILYELSSNLRSDVLLFMDRKLVEKIPFFNNKVPQFVADTISMFQPMVFQEGDFIVKEGTQADEMFFLIKGKAAIYYGSKMALIMGEGTYFGEIGCIMGGIRRAGIKALTTCELQALSRRNLNILLAEYPDVAEELKEVAKSRVKVRKTDAKMKDVSMNGEMSPIAGTSMPEQNGSSTLDNGKTSLQGNSNTTEEIKREDIIALAPKPEQHGEQKTAVEITELKEAGMNKSTLSTDSGSDSKIQNCICTNLKSSNLSPALKGNEEGAPALQRIGEGDSRCMPPVAALHTVIEEQLTSFFIDMKQRVEDEMLRSISETTHREAQCATCQKGQDHKKKTLPNEKETDDSYDIADEKIT